MPDTFPHDISGIGVNDYRQKPSTRPPITIAADAADTRAAHSLGDQILARDLEDGGPILLLSSSTAASILRT